MRREVEGDCWRSIGGGGGGGKEFTWSPSRPGPARGGAGSGTWRTQTRGFPPRDGLALLAPLCAHFSTLHELLVLAALPTMHILTICFFSRPPPLSRSLWKLEGD